MSKMMKELTRALDYINENLPKVVGETYDLMAEPRLNLSITQWHETRQFEAALKRTRAVLTQLNNDIANTLMPAQLDMNGLTSAPHALGLIKINHHFQATQVKGKRAEIHDWLELHGFASLIVPTVNARTLAAALKEPFARGEEIPAELITCKVRRYCSFGDENAPEESE